MRSTRKLSPLARLSFEPNAPHVFCYGNRDPLEAWLPVILEMFVHTNSLARAYANYIRVSTSMRWQRIQQFILPPTYQFVIPEPAATLLLVGRCVFICPSSSAVEGYRLANLQNKSLHYGTAILHEDYLAKTKKEAQVTDLSELSRTSLQVAVVLLRSFGFLSAESLPVFSFARFSSYADSLFAKGLLTIPFGRVQFGDLRRTGPLCPDFGYSRGTPIDRFYLAKFVDEIRNEVVGQTLDIGGRRQNRDHYAFYKTTEYHAMDVTADPDVDFVADAHEGGTHATESFDSILLFNVLEHCEEPWVVLTNVFRWLRPGGKVFCAVPNAQRIHRSPKDYWRFMPDGCISLFRNFCDLRIKTYGNALTVSASFDGIASQELQEHELMALNSDYPVITCVVGKKN
jgi:SAM-dependent methyltransferase